MEKININGEIYSLNQITNVDDGLAMVGNLKPMEVSRYYDKLVYRTKDNVAMACYVNDNSNCWTI